MDNPTSRIFFSFPTRLLCFLVLFAKVFFPTTFSLHISLGLEKDSSLPYQWIWLCNFNRVWSKYFTPNRSQLGAQLKPSWCPLLVCFLLLSFSKHSTLCNQNTYMSRLKTTQKQTQCPRNRSRGCWVSFRRKPEKITKVWTKQYLHKTQISSGGAQCLRIGED